MDKINKVVRINANQDLVETKSFPYASFPFEKFNPIQSGLFEVYEKDANFCIASSTATGKTEMGEMTLSHAIRNRKGKGLYISPLKALTQQKIDTWTKTGHHFSDLKISICTGDYVLTQARQKELSEADLILMTSELFSSRSRNFKSEKSDFLRDVKNITVDECHLLTVPGRGDHLETALMKLSLINPDAKMTFLSATMPNVDQICGWMSKLNGKNTYFLESSWRPTKLNLHYETYYDGSRDYDDTEGEKVAAALQIVTHYKDDKFIVFAHTKRTGELMKLALKKFGISSEFHNADLVKEKRTELENKFLNDPNFRVLVATSGMAQGLNCPARRVIVLGVHRAMTLVPTYEIFQEVGRAGRPGFDPAGDAYILLPEAQRAFHKFRLQTPDRIESQLLSYVGGKDEVGKIDESKRNYKTLAFHIVSEIHHGAVKTRKDIHAWFDRSLAHHQNQWFDSDIVDNVIDLLVNCGAIKEEDKEYKITPIGTLSSMFYFSPFDIADYKRSFGKLFDKGKDDNDVAVAVALGNIDSHRFNIVSKLEREEMSGFVKEVQKLYGIYAVPEPAIKAAFCYWNLMNGKSNPAFNSLMRGLLFDFPRVCQVLQATDHMAAKWGRGNWFRQLKLRIQYGVKQDLVELCRIPDIGAVRAKKLYDAQIRTVDDVVNNPELVKSITRLGPERVAKIVSEARMICVRDELE